MARWNGRWGLLLVVLLAVSAVMVQCEEGSPSLVEKTSEQSSDLTETVKNYASESIKSAADAAREWTAKAGETFQDSAQTGESAYEWTVKKFQDMTGAASTKASDTTEEVKKSAGKFYGDKVGQSTESGNDVYEKAKKMTNERYAAMKDTAGIASESMKKQYDAASEKISGVKAEEAKESEGHEDL